MAADQGILDSVTHGNTKTVADAGAFERSRLFAASVDHQNRMNIIAEAAVGNIVKRLTEVDITEAVSVLKSTGGNLGDLGAVLEALRIQRGEGS